MVGETEEHGGGAVLADVLQHVTDRVRAIVGDDDDDVDDDDDDEMMVMMMMMMVVVMMVTMTKTKITANIRGDDGDDNNVDESDYEQ